MDQVEILKDMIENTFADPFQNELRTGSEDFTGVYQFLEETLYDREGELPKFFWLLHWLRELQRDMPGNDYTFTKISSTKNQSITDLTEAQHRLLLLNKPSAEYHQEIRDHYARIDRIIEMIYSTSPLKDMILDLFEELNIPIEGSFTGLLRERLFSAIPLGRLFNHTEIPEGPGRYEKTEEKRIVKNMFEILMPALGVKDKCEEKISDILYIFANYSKLPDKAAVRKKIATAN